MRPAPEWLEGAVAAPRRVRTPRSSHPLVAIRLTGLVGAVLIALGSYGAGARPGEAVAAWPAPNLLLALSGYAAGLLAWLLGAGLLVSSWWRAGPIIGRLLGPAPEERRAVSRWMAGTGALWALPLVLAAPVGSRDVYSYAAAGDIFAHGLDPYAVGPDSLPSRWLDTVSPAWRSTPAPYGPLFLLIARMVGGVSGGSLLVALFLFRLLSVAGLLLVARYLPVLARACGVAPSTAVWLGLASPIVLIHALGGMHNESLMIGLVVTGLAWATQRKVVPASAALGLAAAIKATAVVAVPFAALLLLAAFRGRYRRLRALATAGAASAVPFLAVTWVSGLGFGWIDGLRHTGQTVSWTSLPTGVGMAVGYLGEALGEPSWHASGVSGARQVGFGVMAVVLVMLWWRARRSAYEVGTARHTRTVVAHAGWALLAVVVLGPAFHPWYVLWPLPLLAAATADDRVRRWLSGAVAVLAFIVLPDGFNLARTVEVPGALLDVAVVTALVVLACRLGWRRLGD